MKHFLLRILITAGVIGLIAYGCNEADLFERDESGFVDLKEGQLVIKENTPSFFQSSFRFGKSLFKYEAWEKNGAVNSVLTVDHLPGETGKVIRSFFTYQTPRV